MLRAKLGLLVACVVVLACAGAVAAAFPPPQKYVSDGANVIDPGTRTELNALLRALETDTTAEVAVVTVPSLDGMTVEDYANRLFKEWGIGKKGGNNGVLVLVAPSERKMRIEVGYGLEPILPDGLAGEIIRQQFTPAFRNGDYSGGTHAGVARIADILRAKHVLTADERKAFEQSGEDRPPAILMVPFFGLFIVVGAFMVGAGFGSKTIFPLIFGALFGGIPSLMAMIPFFNAHPLMLGPLALMAGIVGYKKGGPAFAETAAATRRKGRRRGSRKGVVSDEDTSTSSTGWTWGADTSRGSSSSSSSGSSSSGGSFGGGSSGGGGASGSW